MPPGRTQLTRMPDVHDRAGPAGLPAARQWRAARCLRPRDGSGRRALGTYQDEYVRAGGEWRFAKRSYHVIHQGACDLSGEFRPIPK